MARLGDNVSDSCYGIGAEAISYNGVDKYLRITDITDEGHFAPNPLCSPAFFNESYIATENDLFVARTGASVGKTYLYDSKDGRLIFAGFLMKLNITDANSKFVFYYTQTSQYKNWVISESMRSGQPGLNLKQIKNLSIPLPPIEEQRRIASALTSIDNLIDSLDRLIAKKRDIKQGAMQQLLSGKKRLKGFTEPWVEKKLGDMAETASGGTPSRSNIDYYKGHICWFTTSELTDNYLYDSNEHITNEALSCSSAKLFPIGTLLIAMYGATIGRLGILCTEAATNQACCAINCQKIDTIFLFYLLLLNRPNIIELGCGAGQPNISQDIVKNLEFIVPSSLPEQQAIASVLTSMDNELSALEAKRKKYEQIKQGMMQQLLTGRIRLENASMVH